MKQALLSLVVSVLVVGCGGTIALDDPNSGTGGSSGTGGGSATGGGTATGGGSTATGGGSALDGLPCDVSNLIANKCDSCHGASVAGGAPYSITSRAQLIATAPGQTVTVADRALTRMQAQQMPPGGGNSAADIAVLQNWIAGGMQAGTCGMVTPPTPTCASNSYWTGGNNESDNMNPGLSCQNCHATQKPSRNYFFMGTIFPGVHEKDLCNASPPAGVKLEILDKNGNVVITLTNSFSPTGAIFSPSGNFFFAQKAAVGSNGQAIALPYTARLTGPNGTLTMNTPQMSGNCNSCHTVNGANGAPGRIHW